eukprot:CAMPEP_0184862040 /NCGR_PEP_ID=MMETSP0580-20130426/6574_1 /TAXON_ID=1118495 /ORGANISM="Dactyliosolen fragilissimus" /LENGTH=539 /DNA_ID=CAMNT_0027359753 /DNA_START=177 /DNA_END=1793 /DNA_ORIENTATION=+
MKCLISSMTRSRLLISLKKHTIPKACVLLTARFVTTTSALESGISFRLRDPSLLSASIKEVSSSQKYFEVLNPAATRTEIEDGSAILAVLPSMNRQDSTKIIDNAAVALQTWRNETTGMKRSHLLKKWSELIKENADDIAQIMTLESGKPIRESYGEVTYGTSFLDYYAEEAIRPTSAGGGFITPSPFESTANGSPRGKIMAIHEAVGVTAMITPWNFPLAMITRKVGPALAVGCTSILKPSELTPLTAIAMKTLALRAGIPDHVFQLIISDKANTPLIGTELCTNKMIRKISFTGSTSVGKLLMKEISNNVNRLSLELGGNAPFIVFDDADIDQAVDAAIASKFRNAGQTCICADRFILHTSIEKEFIAKLCKQLSTFLIGSGMNDVTTMGPLITESAAIGIKKKVDEAIADGAERIYGGSHLNELGPNFFTPTVLNNVSVLSRIWREETFGPVIAIARFSREDEAIELANDTAYGLASYFCTKNLERVFRVASRLDNGIVGINDGIISTATAPFGGTKESGLGREGSAMGIAEYLET